LDLRASLQKLSTGVETEAFLMNPWQLQGGEVSKMVISIGLGDRFSRMRSYDGDDHSIWNTPQKERDRNLTFNSGLGSLIDDDELGRIVQVLT
jgi:hypothetical protein